jgi:hypothetical protein
LPNSLLGVGKLEIKNAEILQCLRNTSPWESLGLAYSEKEREREKWMFVTSTWDVFY